MQTLVSSDPLAPCRWAYIFGQIWSNYLRPNQHRVTQHTYAEASQILIYIVSVWRFKYPVPYDEDKTREEYTVECNHKRGD